MQLLRSFLLPSAAVLLLLLSAFLSLSFFLFHSTTTSLHLRSTTIPVPTHNLALRHRSAASPPKASATILFPDNDLLLLLPPSTPLPLPPLLCLFPSGATTHATPAGVLPSSRTPLLRCPLPSPLPLSPRLIFPDDEARISHHPTPRPLQWNHLVYDSTFTPTDVILYAKGVSTRQPGTRCVFLDGRRSVVLARTNVTSAVQEVFRCPHPDLDLTRFSNVRVTLEPSGRRPVPSVATYSSDPSPAASRRSSICACTMVRDVAKFLPEWVAYHSRIGVNRFVLYDNGSEDGLDRVVDRLVEAGHDVTTYLWPWPKTQEAGFSHAAVVNRGSCEWMMYLDVDEFVYSTNWTGSPEPDPDMLPRLLRSALKLKPEPVGQVSIDCRDFGPSGLEEHPVEGVTQGYTCRRKGEERHKSLVRLDSVDHSLRNVIHHFTLRQGHASLRLTARQAVVNHYKYQAWPEFRNKFKRRVSAYVVDWTLATKAGSKDRTPGLGFEAVEPPDWPERFCEVRDAQLKDLTRRWFNRTGPDGSTRMTWTYL